MIVGRIAPATAAAALFIGGLLSPAGWADDPAPQPVTVTVVVAAKVDGHDVRWWAAHSRGKVASFRRHLRVEQRNGAARAREIRRLRAVLDARWRPTVEYAYRLASAVYGVPVGSLRSVGRCESHHRPFARNGRYRGVLQEGPMFEQGPFGQAGFSVWDPVANVLTGARVMAAEGYGQWSCKP